MISLNNLPRVGSFELGDGASGVATSSIAVVLIRGGGVSVL